MIDGGGDAGGSGYAFEIFPTASGFILRIGSVFVALSRKRAEEVLSLLVDALEPAEEIESAPAGSN